MKLLKEMCSLPTAPFVEGAVIEYVERFAPITSETEAHPRFVEQPAA
jgi:hypothetical protein